MPTQQTDNWLATLNKHFSGESEPTPSPVGVGGAIKADAQGWVTDDAGPSEGVFFGDDGLAEVTPLVDGNWRVDWSSDEESFSTTMTPKELALLQEEIGRVLGPDWQESEGIQESVRADVLDDMGVVLGKKAASLDPGEYGDGYADGLEDAAVYLRRHYGLA